MKQLYISKIFLLLSFFSFQSAFLMPDGKKKPKEKTIITNNYVYWKNWLHESGFNENTFNVEQSAIEFTAILKDNRFFLGASTSAYQHEGGHNKILDKNGNYADAIERYAQENGLATPGLAIDLWEKYETVIPKIKQELGVNALRISISWSRVEPDEGNFDKKAIEQYVKMIQLMLQHEIEPIVCFHHYSNPQWFMDKGDFAKAENIESFVNFCATVGHELIKNKVQYFLPINGIQSYGLRAYFNKDQIPYEKNLQKAMEVTANILDAHVAVYHSIKSIYKKLAKNNTDLKEPQIGLFVVYHPLDPVEITVSQRLRSPLTRFACWLGNRIQNPGVFSYFKTGNFDVNVKIPWFGWSASVQRYNKMASESVDFIALSAYASRPMVDFRKYLNDILEDPMRKTGSKNYYACPEIIYRATQYAYEEFSAPMKELHGKEIPIMIMENGISTDNEEQRAWYYKRVIFSIIKAVKDGYPLSGYFPWTATDCFEWRSGKVHTYGLIKAIFENEPGNNNGRPVIGTIKTGAKILANFIKTVVRKS